MTFGQLVLDDLDGLLGLVTRSVTNEEQAQWIKDAIEDLHADYMEWFRDELMGFEHPRGPV